MIKENLHKIKTELPAGVELVAVSKFNSIERIAEAYAAGQRHFGESRVQEFMTKIEVLPADINWHFIGHLQTNKIRQVVGKVALIESVDTEKLLALISKEAEKQGIRQDVLLQIHVAFEETKFGFTPAELHTLINTSPWVKYPGIRLRGIMGMASNTDNEQRITADFKAIRQTFDDILSHHSQYLPDFNIVSMGMSGDWKIALSCGTTSVRIGSAIFGSRMYANH